MKGFTNGSPPSNHKTNNTMKTITLKNTIVRHLLLLVTLGLALSGTTVHAQPTAVTVPVGIRHSSEIPYAIADSLAKRAIDNNLDSIIGVRNVSEFTPILRDMTAQLLAAEPAPTAIPRTQDELWSLSSGVAQELILELIKVRTTAVSGYLKPATVTQLRDPAINQAMVALLVRSLR